MDIEEHEPGGTITLYQGPAFNDDTGADVTCTVQ
jgi:hypothetical protein